MKIHAFSKSKRLGKQRNFSASVFQLLIAAISSVVALSGCGQSGSSEPPPVYETHVHHDRFRRGHGEERRPHADQPAGRDTTDAHPALQVEIRSIDDNQVVLSSDDPAFDQLTLMAEAAPHSADDSGDSLATARCYGKADAGTLKDIRLCQSGSQITIRADRVADTGTAQEVHLLLLRKPTSASGLDFETPRDFTVSELRNIAKTHNYNTRQEFQKLLGAKANMRLHYLNLLPHLSINSISAIASFAGPLSLLGAVGDLVPFLLPNRWAGSHEADHLWKAETLGYKIAKEDAMQIVEGLALSVARDEETLEQLKETRKLNLTAVELVKSLEASGKLTPGHWYTVGSPLVIFDQTIATTEDGIDSELAELADAVGFKSPLAIKSVTVSGGDSDVAHPTDLDLAKMETASVDTSLEIPQLKQMIAAALANMHGRAFEWLDPDGDAQAGLGAGLPSYIEVEKRNVEQLKVAREAAQACLLKKDAQAFYDTRDAVKLYPLSLQGMELEKNRLNTDMGNLKKSPRDDGPVGDIQDTMEKLPLQQNNVIAARYAYDMAMSRIHRLMHTGPYKN